MITHDLQRLLNVIRLKCAKSETGVWNSDLIMSQGTIPPELSAEILVKEGWNVCYVSQALWKLAFLNHIRFLVQGV